MIRIGNCRGFIVKQKRMVRVMYRKRFDVAILYVEIFAFFLLRRNFIRMPEDGIQLGIAKKKYNKIGSHLTIYTFKVIFRGYVTEFFNQIICILHKRNFLEIYIMCQIKRTSRKKFQLSIYIYLIIMLL